MFLDTGMVRRRLHVGQRIEPIKTSDLDNYAGNAGQHKNSGRIYRHRRWIFEAQYPIAPIETIYSLILKLTTRTAKIENDAVIVCDDVRREITNKAILLGVWPLELVVPVHLFELTFVLHVEGAVLDSGAIEPRLWIKDDMGGILFDSDVTSKLEPGEFIRGRFSVDFNVQFQATCSCFISFIVSVGNKEHTIGQRRIALMAEYKADRDKELGLLQNLD